MPDLPRISERAPQATAGAQQTGSRRMADPDRVSDRAGDGAGERLRCLFRA